MNNSHTEDALASGEAGVFLISLKAGGVALNLTEANRVYLMDSWWNPAVEYQVRRSLLPSIIFSPLPFADCLRLL